MDLPTVILAILGVAVSAGAVTAYYRKGMGEEQLKVSQNIIDMQKEENALLVRKNTALQAQLDVANNVIERLSKDGKDSSGAEK